MLSLSKSKAGDAPTDRLPSVLPASPHRERTRVTGFGGLDLNRSKPWGITAMKNLSPRRAPYLSTRRPRELLAPSRGSGTPHGVAVLEGDLYFVQGTTLYRIADALGRVQDITVETVGTLSDGDKQMTVFNGRLLILPDKQYVDAADGILRPMELDLGVLEDIEFSDNQIILPRGVSWVSQGFHAGDSVYVQMADAVIPAPEGYYRIKETHGREAVVTASFSTPLTTNARILRHVPDMDAMAVCGNRLMGFKGKDIYICAEGESLGWQGKQSDGRGPAGLHTATDGDITACAQWQGYMIFFKSSRICRVLGSRTDSFVLTEMAAPGIPSGLAHTLCEVEGDLYYHGDSGVYRYSSVTERPVRVGCFEGNTPISGRGGSDGQAYYLDTVARADDGTELRERRLFIPTTGDWYREDAVEVADTVGIGGYLCTQDTFGRLWLCRSDGRMAGCAYHEGMLFGSLQATVTFGADYAHEPDGYRPIHLYLRATSEEDDAELRVYLSPADGREGRDAVMPLTMEDAGAAEECDNVMEVACFSGRMQDRLLRIPLSGLHCDHMILALDMRGAWELGALITEYEVLRR